MSPLVNPGIEIRIQLRDGPRNLRSHLDRDHCIDGSGRLHDIVDLPSFHFRSKVLRLRAAVQPENGKQPGHDHGTRQDHPLPFYFHAWSWEARSRRASLMPQRLNGIE